MSSQQLDTRQQQALDRVAASALDIGSDDLSLPRLYIGQGLSECVSAGTAKLGDIYVAFGKDDTDATVLSESEGPQVGVPVGKGVIVHVLGMHKSISARIDGEFKTWQIDDDDAPEYGVGNPGYLVYNYLLAIPSYDDAVPVKLAVSGTGAGAARIANTILKKLRGVPFHSQAFEFSSRFATNEQGKYFVPVLRKEDGSDETKQIAADLFEMVNANEAAYAEAQAEGDDAPV